MNSNMQNKTIQFKIFFFLIITLKKMGLFKILRPMEIISIFKHKNILISMMLKK